MGVIREDSTNLSRKMEQIEHTVALFVSKDEMKEVYKRMSTFPTLG